MVGKVLVTTKINTVEHRLTAISVISCHPRYYSQFFSARQNSQTFPYKKNVNAVTHKYQTVESLIIAPC